MPRRGAFVKEFGGFDGRASFGDGFLQQLDAAVPDFCVVRLVGVEVELFFGADWCVNGDVLPFSVCSEGVEKLACSESWGFAFTFELETKISAEWRAFEIDVLGVDSCVGVSLGFQRFPQRFAGDWISGGADHFLSNWSGSRFVLNVPSRAKGWESLTAMLFSMWPVFFAVLG